MDDLTSNEPQNHDSDTTPYKSHYHCILPRARLDTVHTPRNETPEETPEDATRRRREALHHRMNYLKNQGQSREIAHHKQHWKAMTTRNTKR